MIADVAKTVIDSAVAEVAAGGAIDDNFGRQGSFRAYMLVYVRRSAVASLFAPVPDNEIPHATLSFVDAQAAHREGERHTVNFSLITEASLERAAAAHAFGLYAASIDAERAAILAFDVRQSCAELCARVVGALSVDSCELYVSDMPIPDSPDALCAQIGNGPRVFACKVATGPPVLFYVFVRESFPPVRFAGAVAGGRSLVEVADDARGIVSVWHDASVEAWQMRSRGQLRPADERPTGHCCLSLTAVLQLSHRRGNVAHHFCSIASNMKSCHVSNISGCAQSGGTFVWYSIRIANASNSLPTQTRTLSRSGSR
jgi:hypothetical protein